MVFELIQPIFGFEYIDKVKLTKVDDYFMRLESIDGKEQTSFTLINPYKLRDYSIELPPFFKGILKIEDKSKVSIYNIIVMHTSIEKSTVNFIAPLVFNEDKKLAAQVMLDTMKYIDYSVAEKVEKWI